MLAHPPGLTTVTCSEDTMATRNDTSRADRTARFAEIIRQTRELMHGTPAEQRRALDFLDALREHGGPLQALAEHLDAYAMLPPSRLRH